MLSKARFKTHGLSHSPEYHAWHDMKARCTDREHNAFKYYGGRGIKVCDDWLTGSGSLEPIECFVRDMGMRPKGKFSLERRDTDGDYEPSNCYWAPLSLQARNRRVCTRHYYKGESLSVADLAEKYSIPMRRIQSRLEIGWTIQDAIERPARFSPTRSETWAKKRL